MRKGQVGLGLVIFAIVAIIAVIGLVLLFTRASESTGAAIGQSYNQYWDYMNPGEGIVQTHAQQPMTYGAAPIESPALLATVPASFFGNRIPAFVMMGGYRYEGYKRFPDDAGTCWDDLRNAFIVAHPEDSFSCYALPWQGNSQAMGSFPSENAARARPTAGTYKSLSASGPYGGDSACYMLTTSGTTGEGISTPMMKGDSAMLDSDTLMREHIVEKLVVPDKWDYYDAVMLDGSHLKVPACSANRDVWPLGSN
ncbi:hypothetical protein KY329_01515 [Candidatus Woesearchaeota archaeon]|nr:hypothetical protein [Candidatus Woesearchaeota archaeon]